MIAIAFYITATIDRKEVSKSTDYEVNVREVFEYKTVSDFIDDEIKEQELERKEQKIKAYREELARQKEEEKRLAEEKAKQEELARQKTEQEEKERLAQAEKTRKQEQEKQEKERQVAKAQHKNNDTKTIAKAEASPSRGGGRSLGTFQSTAYCSCVKCTGTEGVGRTASGTIPTVGKTVAVDPKVIPLGSKVVINEHTYIAEDTGSAIKGKIVDLYFSSHSEALKWGRRNITVKIIE